ncbi:MAG TPA: CPBP family glutamic-type intramembrane protease [Sphingomicrobium sp.]|nr:CPBP family glutamic-type intramembrane protease [Sphingomicrobium sp.]
MNAGPALRIAWAPPVSWLPEAVRNPSSVLRSVALGWLVAFSVTILIAGAIQLVAPDARSPEFAISGPIAVALLAVFSPIAETLIMGGVLLILLRFLPPTWAVVASAVGWGVVHSLAAPVWGLIIWWPFLVFSTLFVAWRERSLTMAFVIPAIVHGLHNLPSAVFVATAVPGA